MFTDDELIELSAFGVVPGMRAVFAAFRENESGLDWHTIPRSSHEALSEISPIRSPLAGGNVATAIALVGTGLRPPRVRILQRRAPSGSTSGDRMKSHPDRGRTDGEF